ncbi:MotA/TolQ/ExbB proton channel family protein [Catenovulum adriaticum]|uniref:MotA/TolQ/ExbB proton channel family protein n=2 Tax=Catenovulum adriaticum TaxID=2984846 RepID=A0ABY7AQT1_9ALTE|nr:MotA/TolQ/ExbB proton channel family protein [Catenovulum sp. TS8]WAJ71627.1 MotA/TolQ/ExbB proton channel family protein [Catenovulum sp. TS8]
MTTSVFAAQENTAVNLDQLLTQLEQGKLFQNTQNEQREKEFLAKKAQQVQMLNEADARRTQLTQRSESLETTFEKNEIELANLSETLNNRMGSLKELFGVLQQVAGDMQGKFENSIISAQYPNRGVFLDELAQKMGQSSKLASVEEIERVWFELQREMTESGKITRFDAPVMNADTGTKNQQEVVRVGAFNLVSNGKFLEYVKQTGSLAELSRQPSDRYLSTASAVQEQKGELVEFALDPTGGSILGLLVQAPNMTERVEQGGTVGYVILAVGLIGLLIAIERFISLTIIGGKIKRQLKQATPSTNNPLGRVMKVKTDNPTADSETLELKLSEAILREVPKLARNLTFIKIISVVAPLLGLLGTVTGMINTFQAITLFGTGDPKLMAGGISQALVTTVLGLVVAIPTLLLYTVLNTRSRGLISILQEQSAGIIAERAEQGE